jgi:hypothetical protein
MQTLPGYNIPNISSSSSSSSNNNNKPFQNHTENTRAPYQEPIKLGNYRKLPHWALKFVHICITQYAKP